MLRFQAKTYDFNPVIYFQYWDLIDSDKMILQNSE